LNLLNNELFILDFGNNRIIKSDFNLDNLNYIRLKKRIKKNFFMLNDGLFIGSFLVTKPDSDWIGVFNQTGDIVKTFFNEIPLKDKIRGFDIKKFVSLSIRTEPRIAIDKNKSTLAISSFFVENPIKKYEKRLLLKNGKIDGFSIFRNGKFNDIKIGIILDIFANDKEGFDELLNEIIGYFTKTKMKFVSCYMINNNFFYKTLLKRGFKQIKQFAGEGKKGLSLTGFNRSYLCAFALSYTI